MVIIQYRSRIPGHHQKTESIRNETVIGVDKASLGGSVIMSLFIKETMVVYELITRGNLFNSDGARNVQIWDFQLVFVRRVGTLETEICSIRVLL